MLRVDVCTGNIARGTHHTYWQNKRDQDLSYKLLLNSKISLLYVKIYKFIINLFQAIIHKPNKMLFQKIIKLTIYKRLAKIIFFFKFILEV